ncbi:hypothetical protein NBRC111894_1370 [Sporolactobacillus inulinus]|uniref:Uncharacterized protein n=1 Tax=Sporolactobacillus inulinus TaxID=2078 RepID=A0A4Y1Z9X2_9BACL|nr:hypothetical protein NBRC111894_1370 [Sporolactobacillus inulinus]
MVSIIVNELKRNKNKNVSRFNRLGIIINPFIMIQSKQITRATAILISPFIYVQKLIHINCFSFD